MGYFLAFFAHLCAAYLCLFQLRHGVATGRESAALVHNKCPPPPGKHSRQPKSNLSDSLEEAKGEVFEGSLQNVLENTGRNEFVRQSKAKETMSYPSILTDVSTQQQ